MSSLGTFVTRNEILVGFRGQNLRLHLVGLWPIGYEVKYSYTSLRILYLAVGCKLFTLYDMSAGLDTTGRQIDNFCIIAVRLLE